MKVPMRKKDREITDSSEIEKILKQGEVISVAMCQGDQPYVLPFNYGYLNGLIYIHSSKKGFKLDVLAQNPKVSFNVTTDVQLLPADNPKDCSVAYSSVVGFGRVRMVDDPVRTLMRALDTQPTRPRQPIRSWIDAHQCNQLQRRCP